jgi:hypothetical protein
VRPWPLTLVTCSIPAGQSLSSGVSLSAGRLVRIRTPVGWKPANLTFQCRIADVPAQYRDVYNRIGAEIVIASVRPDSVIALPSEVTAFLQDAWIKLRSGHAGIAVPQLGAVRFRVRPVQRPVDNRETPSPSDRK